MTVLRFRPGVPGCPPTDMYINVQSKTSWSALGTRIANLAPSLWKPMGRGRVALRRRDHRQEPLVEMNFAGHELDLKRLMRGFRLAVEMLAYEKVRAMTGVTFPVKFTDRLRQLNRRTLGKRGEGAAHRLADRSRAGAGRARLRHAGRPQGRSRSAGDGRRRARRAHPPERRRHVPSSPAPAGWAAPNDRDAVVDTEGRVRGFDGLRVVDASIMPTVPRANTNIPTIMLAEKISAAMADEARAAA